MNFQSESVSKSPMKLSQDSVSNTNSVVELALCAADPLYFLLNYVKIEDRIRQKVLPFHLFPYQVDLFGIFLAHKKIIILKARQLGVSWLVVAYCLWKALFHPNTKILFLSQQENKAAELVGGGEGNPGKAKFIWQNLPDWMRPDLGRDTQEIIDFKGNGSTLEALASTINAGRGTDATITVRDELTYHPYAEPNFSAINPAINRGGQLIDLSTADRTKSDYHFKNRYLQAKKGEINVKRVFLSRELEKDYLDLVGIDYDIWVAEQKKELGVLFEGEYPLTEDEALSVTESQRYFSIDALNDLANDVKIPLGDISGLNTRNGAVKVFKPAVVGNTYAVYTDPSMGKDDPSHIIVIKSTTEEEVCNFHGNMPADEVAGIHDSIVRYYNDAFNSFEYNAYAGGVFKSAIERLGTPRVMPTRTPDDKIKEGSVGIWISNQYKKKLLGHMATKIYNKEVIVHDAETIDEFNTMMWITGEDMPRVPEKLHDDRIMAWAGVLEINRWVPSGSYGVVSHVIQSPL